MMNARSFTALLVAIFVMSDANPIDDSVRAGSRSAHKPPYQISAIQARIFGPGIISTADYEANSAFTPDGRTFYFTKRNVGYSSSLWAICRSSFSGGSWGAPEVAEFSGQYRDSDPFISPDGAKLFFISDRPADSRPRGNFDIWVMDKKDTGWGEPRNLGMPVNTPAVEYYPTVTMDGTLYFCSNRENGRGAFDIYRSRPAGGGKYAEPENLGEAINTKFSDLQPFIAPDESFLIFVSVGRPDETMARNFYYPRGDLYISYKRDGVWTVAKNLGWKVNTPAAESRPNMSPDGKYLFFTSERGFATPPLQKRKTYRELIAGIRSTLNGLGNIYQIEFDALIHAAKISE